MKIGIGSFSYAWAVGVPGFDKPTRPVGHFDLLENAGRLGVQVVQYVDNLPLTALSPDKLDRLTGRAAELGVEIEIGMRGIDPAGLREHLALAKRVKSGFVRALFQVAATPGAPGEAVAALRSLLPEFEEAGVLLVLENHENQPARVLRQVIEELGTGRVRACLDTINSMGRLETPDVVIDALTRVTRNLHLKDFVIKRVPAQLGFIIEGTPAGTGVLDVPDLLRRLPADCTVVLEQWPPLGPDMDETAAREARWAEESIAYLKRAAAGLPGGG
jgi:sugar phosphate isomerase/epimerase